MFREPTWMWRAGGEAGDWQPAGPPRSKLCGQTRPRSPPLGRPVDTESTPMTMSHRVGSLWDADYGSGGQRGPADGSSRCRPAGQLEARASGQGTRAPAKGSLALRGRRPRDPPRRSPGKGSASPLPLALQPSQGRQRLPAQRRGLASLPSSAWAARSSRSPLELKQRGGAW